MFRTGTAHHTAGEYEHLCLADLAQIIYHTNCLMINNTSISL